MDRSPLGALAMVGGRNRGKSSLEREKEKVGSTSLATGSEREEGGRADCLWNGLARSIDQLQLEMFLLAPTTATRLLLLAACCLAGCVCVCALLASFWGPLFIFSHRVSMLCVRYKFIVIFTSTWIMESLLCLDNHLSCTL